MLEVSGLTTGYGKRRVLNDVSLRVSEGEIVLVIGHNGAGKSTLLKTIFGILPAWAGTIRLGGDEIQNSHPVDIVKHGLGFVRQGNRVFTELSIEDHLKVGGHMVRGRAELQSRVEMAYDLFPLLAVRHKQMAGTLSGGEQQMLALATALMVKPKVLMMDEPSLGLSPNLVSAVLDQVRRLNTELGMTILMIEQRVHEALKIAHRVYVLRLGEVAFTGTASDLLEGEKLKEVYLS